MKNLKSFYLGGCLFLTALCPIFVHAQNTVFAKGNINIRATVIGSCMIGGAKVEEGESYHLSEALNFGQASPFKADTVDSQVVVKYDCFSENGLKVYLDSSANENGNGADRILQLRGGNNKIKYALFSDSMRDNMVLNGDLLFESDPKVYEGNIAIYGRAYLKDQSTAVANFKAGKYEDTIKFSIEF